MNAYILKIIAIVGMALQHAALVLGDTIPTVLHFPFQLAGGFTFPIMAFLLVEGYRHTRNVKAYALRLGIFALVSQPFYMWAFGTWFGFNIMFILAIGVLSLMLYDYTKGGAHAWVFWLAFVPYTLISLMADWGIVGPVMILLYHVVKKEGWRRTLSPVIAGVYNFGLIMLITALAVFVEFVFPGAMGAAVEGMGVAVVDPLMGLAGLMFPVGSILSLFCLRAYNGERGPGMKYFFYAFYPAHLAALGLATWLLR
ncbi:MAG: conjugal transfer protein TraX [Defluviitaleaceae bacterium]|nr:conjugal transfer protein TraX [Defluviitaleaceae bacterium]